MKKCQWYRVEVEAPFGSGKTFVTYDVYGENAASSVNGLARDWTKYLGKVRVFILKDKTKQVLTPAVYRDMVKAEREFKRGYAKSKPR